MDLGTNIIIGVGAVSAALMIYSGQRLQKRENILVSEANDKMQLLEETLAFTESVTSEMNEKERKTYYNCVYNKLDGIRSLGQRIQDYTQEISSRNKYIEQQAMSAFTTFGAALRGIDTKLERNN